MRVKCIKLISATTSEELDSSSWLTIGKIYTVVEVLVGQSSKEPQFRIITNDNGSPVYCGASEFELVSGYVPSSFAVNFKPGKYWELSPKAWQRDDFWDAYFDTDEEWAIQLFNEEVKKMIEEEEEYLAKQGLS